MRTVDPGHASADDRFLPAAIGLLIAVLAAYVSTIASSSTETSYISNTSLRRGQKPAALRARLPHRHHLMVVFSRRHRYFLAPFGA
jgi:hypothetical protein